MRFAIPLILLAALVALFAAGLGKNPGELPSPLIGKPAPSFTLPVMTLADAPSAATVSPPLLTNADFIGQPMLVNFFASWCAGCQVEHPFLMQLARSGKVRILGIDYKDADADARAWLGRLGNPYGPILVDLDGRAGIDYGVYGVPETFVVAADGRVLHKHVGALTPEAWQSTIEPLLSASR